MPRKFQRRSNPFCRSARRFYKEGDPEPTTGGGNTDSSEDNSKLLATVKATREERDKIKAQLDAREKEFKDLQAKAAKLQQIDPDEYDRLRKAQEQAEEQKKIEQQQWQSLRQDAEIKIQKANEQSESWKKRYQDLMIRTAAKDSFLRSGGRIGEANNELEFFDFFYPQVSRFVSLEDAETGKIRIADVDGTTKYDKDNKPIESLDALMLHLKLSGGAAATFFDPSDKGSGSGGQNNGKYRSGGIHDANFASLPAAERRRILREQG